LYNLATFLFIIYYKMAFRKLNSIENERTTWNKERGAALVGDRTFSVRSSGQINTENRFLDHHLRIHSLIGCELNQVRPPTPAPWLSPTAQKATFFGENFDPAPQRQPGLLMPTSAFGNVDACRSKLDTGRSVSLPCSDGLENLPLTDSGHHLVTEPRVESDSACCATLIGHFTVEKCHRQRHLSLEKVPEDILTKEVA
ncbi:hypothetical protein T08_4422, partial [Trichinella sp. T8]